VKIDALPGLAALDEGRWNTLLERSRLPSIFLTWQWQTEWSRAFAADRPQQILTATDDDGSLVGVLPLYEDGPARQRIIGGVDVSDYLDLIAVDGREEEVWAALLQHCATQTAVCVEKTPRAPRSNAPRGGSVASTIEASWRAMRPRSATERRSSSVMLSEIPCA